jgi:hypothetical protein
MSCKFRPTLGAFCLALTISAGSLFVTGASAADKDDHSYLPPWMVGESAAPAKGDENANAAGVQAGSVQPARTEVQAVETKELNSANLTAKAAGVKTRVVGFVSNLVRRSVRFATGE